MLITGRALVEQVPMVQLFKIQLSNPIIQNQILIFIS